MSAKDEQATESSRPAEYNPFDLDTETIQADWWPEWMTVTVREITFNEAQELVKLGLRQEAELPSNRRGKRRQNFKVRDTNFSLLRVSTLAMGIVSWTFRGKNGKTLPITNDNLGKLRVKDADFILEVLDRLNPETDEEFPDAD